MDSNQMLALMQQYQQEGKDIATLVNDCTALLADGRTPLGLNQWKRSDKPMMEDFNEDNRIVDGKLRELDEGVRQVNEKKLNIPMRIPDTSGNDLNNYTVPGMYFCPVTQTAASLSNLPAPYAFSLLVEKHAGYKQTFTVFHTADTYIRCFNGTWGAWRKIVFA